MKLDFIDLGKLSVSKANMRYAKKAPDVSDILPTVRKRGVLVPILVRPNCAPDAFEVVAGARRFHAAMIVAGEHRASGLDVDPMPCAILGEGDDADAIEASLIENLDRLDPDEVTQWETFSRLVKEGRNAAEIAATFGLPDRAIKQILALGNLLPRIRDLYRNEKIDRATVRLLTLASTARQREWLALAGDPEANCPTGHRLKAWLFGGQSIKTSAALFDTAGMTGIVSDLFGEDSYFGDTDAFWTLQNAEIEARRAAYVADGWGEVVVVPAGTHFSQWEHSKLAKTKGGRVYIDVQSSGEVEFHEGFVTEKEARRIAKGEAPGAAKVARPEVTIALQTYIDLHRHAACRAALLAHPGTALRMMVAHALCGSALWTVKPEMQVAKQAEVSESVETCAGETIFDAARRQVLALLGFAPDVDNTIGGNGDEYRLVSVFLRLMALDESDVMRVIAVVMGESLAAGSAAVDALGTEFGLDMAGYWQADEAFYGLLRDREVLGALVEEVAGKVVADANRQEKVKTLKQIVRDHLEGDGGRAKVLGWVPKWLAFPPAAYTQRGGVGSVAAHARVIAARAELSETEAEIEVAEEPPQQLAA